MHYYFIKKLCHQLFDKMRPHVMVGAISRHYDVSTIVDVPRWS